MNEKPILFTAEMVRAILEGRKSQTRRIVKRNASGRVKAIGSPKNWHLEDPNAVLACPYGVAGDRLWVRETWHNESSQTLIRYRASGDDLHPLKKWKSPRYMPRWASRINLEITRVRVERIKDISEEDAKAEGVECSSDKAWSAAVGHPDPYKWAVDHGHRADFEDLWDSINAKRENGKYSWDKNPWVWVIEFKRIEE